VPPTPNKPDLEASSDSGTSNSDDVTNAAIWDITVSGLLSNVPVRLFFNEIEVASQLSTGDSTTFTISDFQAIPDGIISVTAVQVLNNVPSLVSEALTITKDTTFNDFTSTPAQILHRHLGGVNVQYVYDIDHTEEADEGFSYVLVDAPAGAAIGSPQGGLIWTPNAAGDYTFQIRGTDLAGNTLTQTLEVEVLGTPTTPDLQPESDTGISNTDNITNASTWVFTVDNVVDGNTVNIKILGLVIGSATAVGTTATVTVPAAAVSAALQGQIPITASMVIGSLESAVSVPLMLTKDTIAPAAISSTPPATAHFNAQLLYDAAHAEEESPGFAFSLVNAPQGATINPQSGLLTWTPTPAQAGLNTFQIRVTDAAGNSNTQNLNITVSDPNAQVIDKVAFAKALTAAGAIMYGADWCPHCTATKNLFEDGKLYINFVEVTNPDHSPNAIATANNITSYPTWVFANGQRLTGQQTLEAISAASGVPIPVGHTPSLAPISNVTLLHDSPLNIPLDGYDPNGGPLTYEISISNPSILTGEVLDRANRTAKIIVNNFGEMLLYLFEDDAPVTTANFIALAQANKYDSTIFHRVIQNFMIQGGDPTGTGTGDPSIPAINDEFSLNLQHNREGVLSMAKAGDDSGSSQFFITAGPTRHLDFNHSIFGQLLEGFGVRAGIARVPVNANDRPLTTSPLSAVTINDVEIFVDQENGMLRLKAANGVTSGSTRPFPCSSPRPTCKTMQSFMS
jgi:cyclophilin family peptidyl-prolyl cis-trans isomerase/glutaredoxin